MKQLSDPLLRIGTHPLSVLWLLGAVGIVAGIVDWLFVGGLPWEGFGAALVIAAITRVAARVKGISPWPWTDRGHARPRGG